jgi:hypothetical protein
MSKPDKNKVMLAQHIFEVRYAASGTFLDVRGYIADYIRADGFFPHWKIDANVINFQDEAAAIKSDGAFVGYKSAGYVGLNPQTRNYFSERASSFWKLLVKNSHYKIPQPVRFGARTSLFVPSELSFDEINKIMFEHYFTDKSRSLIGGNETDFQFTIDLKEDVYDLRLLAGPLHKNEAKQYFQFESEHFEKCGIYLDVDYFTTDNLTLEVVPKLLKQAIDLTWKKAELIASGLGL